MRVYANAKINVYLKVLGKNAQGYHDLDSLMVPIDLCDVIDIYDNDDDEILGMDIPLENNLIYKAIDKVRRKCGISTKVKVVIEKNIPSFAGLGGGSSDAASIIKTLNQMWNLNLTTDEMIELASEIGSDVPFFIVNKPAIISGRGEKIKEVTIEQLQGILIFDGLKFSTKAVFENMCEYSLPYDEKEIIKDGVISDCYSLVCNDLEKGIAIYSESARIEEQKKLLLKMGAKKASMSGSGSSVFGLFAPENEELLQKAYDELKEIFESVWKIKTFSC